MPVLQGNSCFKTLIWSFQDVYVRQGKGERSLELQLTCLNSRVFTFSWLNISFVCCLRLLFSLEARLFRVLLNVVCPFNSYPTNRSSRQGRQIPPLLASKLKHCDLLHFFHRCSPVKAKAVALSFLPILTWLPSYPVKEYLFSDVVSGLSTGVVQLPQGQSPASERFVGSLKSIRENDVKNTWIKTKLPYYGFIKLYMKMDWALVTSPIGFW